MGRAKIIVAAGAVIVIILSLLASLTFFSSTGCIPVKQLDASLKVKVLPTRGMLGLNADTDSLKFGVVSPGLIAERKVLFQHSRPAKVTVAMEGDLAGWTSVIPAEFSSAPQETKEVRFEVQVPLDAGPGDYTGRAVFCVKEA